MRFRILIFILFQVIAWSLFFRADQNKSQGAIRTLRVTEIVGEEENASINQIHSYDLILRNDGLFSKLINNNIVESGLWSVNYDIPSLILKSPANELRFKIVQYNGSDLEIMLINQHELEEMSITGNNKAMDLLFSSSTKDY